MMLFLGAGASKPFGLLTMEEMEKKFEEVVEEELTWDEKGLYLRIGAILESEFNNGIWDPKGYKQDIKFKIFKLHGAIDQYITEKGRIVKVGVLGATRTVDGERLKEAVIYPMREKEVYKDPFFESFTRLKDSLLSEKICVVIGYSFGDEHSRNIFFDAVKRNEKCKNNS